MPIDREFYSILNCWAVPECCYKTDEFLSCRSYVRLICYVPACLESHNLRYVLNKRFLKFPSFWCWNHPLLN